MSWHQELHGSVDSLQQRNLLRVQRPTLPQPSSVEALIHERDIEAWANGALPLPNSVTVTHWREAALAHQPPHVPSHGNPSSSRDASTISAAARAETSRSSGSSSGSGRVAHTRSTSTDNTNYSKNNESPSSSDCPPARPFVLLPPPSASYGYGARTPATSIVQAWKGSGQSNAAGALGHSIPSTHPHTRLLASPCMQHTHTPAPQHLSSIPRQHHPSQTQPHSQLLQGGDPPAPLKSIKLFSLNDYLGLSAHPDVAAAAASAVLAYGMGARSSGVVGGTCALHRELEESLAALKGTQDCLLCPTGFAANMAVLTALTSMGGRHVAILSDALNHASIIDGARLACRGGAASLHVYRHNDVAHLEQLLQGLPRDNLALVITDSLFSMDGDFADLKALAALRARYGFLLAVDEAHATLVCGDRGAGAAEAQGVDDQVDVHIGTLSKAFGALGGFVATSAVIKALVLNKGRAHVYSTALPIPVVAAAQAALVVSNRERWRRTAVWSLVKRLGDGLGIPAQSPIVPIIIGGEAEVVALASKLLKEHGMHVPAIRPPTVPQGTCRLRVSLSAAHTIADVDVLVAVIKQCLGELK